MKFSLKSIVSLAMIWGIAAAAPLDLETRQVPGGDTLTIVVLYRDAGHTGPYTYTRFTGTCFNVGALDNQISSFWINNARTPRCWFYKDLGCTGVSYNTPNSNPDLGGVAGWNDVISSFSCE